MNGFLNQHVSRAYVAQRQADFESAARHSRLIRSLKDARRDQLDQLPTRGPRPGPGCIGDLG